MGTSRAGQKVCYFFAFEFGGSWKDRSVCVTNKPFDERCPGCAVRISAVGRYYTEIVKIVILMTGKSHTCIISAKVIIEMKTERLSEIFSTHKREL